MSTASAAAANSAIAGATAAGTAAIAAHGCCCSVGEMTTDQHMCEDHVPATTLVWVHEIGSADIGFGTTAAGRRRSRLPIWHAQLRAARFGVVKLRVTPAASVCAWACQSGRAPAHTATHKAFGEEETVSCAGATVILDGPPAQARTWQRLCTAMHWQRLHRHPASR